MTDKPKVSTPELEKLAAARSDISLISEFVEWLYTNELYICYHEPRHFANHGGTFYQITEKHENVISRFLGIDPRKVEEERQALLNSLYGEDS